MLIGEKREELSSPVVAKASTWRTLSNVRDLARVLVRERAEFVVERLRVLQSDALQARDGRLTRRRVSGLRRGEQLRHPRYPYLRIYISIGSIFAINSGRKKNLGGTNGVYCFKHPRDLNFVEFSNAISQRAQVYVTVPEYMNLDEAPFSSIPRPQSDPFKALKFQISRECVWRIRYKVLWTLIHTQLGTNGRRACFRLLSSTKGTSSKTRAEIRIYTIESVPSRAAKSSSVSSTWLSRTLWTDPYTRSLKPQSTPFLDDDDDDDDPWTPLFQKGDDTLSLGLELLFQSKAWLLAEEREHARAPARVPSEGQLQQSETHFRPKLNSKSGDFCVWKRCLKAHERECLCQSHSLPHLLARLNWKLAKSKTGSFSKLSRRIFFEKRNQERVTFSTSRCDCFRRFLAEIPDV